MPARSASLLPVSKEHKDIGYPEWRDVVEECFVRTISKVLSARYYGSEQAELLSRVMDEYKLGFILTKHILASLPEYEASGQTFGEFFPRFLQSIQVENELERWNTYWATAK